MKAKSPPFPFRSWSRLGISASLIVALTAGALSPQWSHSSEDSFYPGKYQITRSDGSTESYRIRTARRMSGLRELEYVLTQERFLLPDTETPVLVARDLDGDEYPDAYFYRNEEGELETEEKASVRKDGWDEAQPLILSHLGHENRSLLTTAVEKTLTTLSLTADAYQQIRESLYREEIDLETLELLTDRLQELRPHDSFVGLNRSVIAEGYQALAERALNEEVDRLWLHYKMDVGITLATGGVYKAATWALGGIGGALMTRYSQYFPAKKALGTVATPATQALTAAEASALARVAAAESVRVSLAGALARNKAVQVMSKTLSTVGTVAKAGASQWKYVVTTQAIQIAAEAMARGDAVLDPNPLIVAKNLATNTEFLQNFLFMSNETFWLTALSTHIQNPGKRILACALFSLIDSNVMNYAVKGVVDPKRMALDSGWQMIIGNAQTQLDLAALSSTQALAASRGNSKLKLLGYLVVIADQGAGFYGYSKAATALEEKPKGPVETRLVPVMTEMP